MARLLTSALITTAVTARYPNAGGTQPGNILPSLSASEGDLDEVHAGAVKGFATVSGKLQWLKCTDHFSVNGELVLIGDFVQVPALEAKGIVAAGRAEFATDAEVAAAGSTAAK